MSDKLQSNPGNHPGTDYAMLVTGYTSILRMILQIDTFTDLLQ